MINEKIDTQMISMQLITIAGNARTYAFEALQQAKKKDYVQAKEGITKAQKAIQEAHRIQTNLLFAFANEKTITLDILLVHAQDHLMTCMLAIELIEEMIEVYEYEKEGR